MAKIKIFRGDTFSGTITLRTVDVIDSTKLNTYVIPAGAQIDLKFPGSSGTVVLSTTTPGEITILNADKGTLQYKGSSAKSALLNVGDAQPIDFIVTELSGDITTFEKLKILQVLDRANQ